jgi:hypothetical protein
MGSGYRKLARIVRMSGWTSLVAGILATVLAGPQPHPPVAPQPPANRDQLLDRAGAKVETYLAELPMLVATESMSQRASRSPGSTDGVEHRVWIAEVAWVRLADDEAIAVRDVLEVDGQSVAAERSRLVHLLHGARRGTWGQARALLNEGARHNLVSGTRNFNLPTVALFFLHPERQSRFAWKGRVPRDASWPWPEPVEIEFRERSRPTLIRGAGGEQIYSRGRMWLNADGTVVRTELRLEIERVKYTLDTRFAFTHDVGLVVPVALEEHYEAPDGSVVSSATYSNYRRYQTGARLVP